MKIDLTEITKNIASYKLFDVIQISDTSSTLLYSSSKIEQMPAVLYITFIVLSLYF